MAATVHADTASLLLLLLWRVIQQPSTPSQVTLPPVPAGVTGPRNSTDLFSVREALEKAMAPHSSTLAWRIPWTEEPGGVQSMRSWRVRHDWATSLSLFTFMHCRRKWQPTPVFLPGESQGRGSLVGCRLWGHTESGTTERLSSSSREALLLAQVLLGKHQVSDLKGSEPRSGLTWEKRLYFSF